MKIKKMDTLDYSTGICFGFGIGALIGKVWPQVDAGLFSTIFMFIAAILEGSRFLLKKNDQ